MHIEIQAVQTSTMAYRIYRYNDVKDVDKYIKMHNNKLEFVATYRVTSNEYASNWSLDDHNQVQSQG